MAFALVALVLARQALIVFELFGPGNPSQDDPRARITHAALREDVAAPVRLGGYEPH
jgi:hypothetical protein